MKKQTTISRFNKWLVILAVSSILSSQIAFAECSCSGYFNETNDYSEYENDIINDELYQTSGSTFCSGLKKYDIDEADKAARKNLSQLIYVKVQTKDKVRTVASDFDTAISEYVQQSNLESNLAITGAYIAKRWVDPSSCSVFSSIRLSTENAKEALKTFKDSFENSVIYIKPSQYSSLDQAILDELKNRGVKTISLTPNNHRYLVTGSIFNIVQRKNNELTLNIRVDIINAKTGGIVKSVTVAGKSMSYQKRTKEYLQVKAINDGLVMLRDNLKIALDEIQ